MVKFNTKIIKRIFGKRVLIFRWQLNIFAAFCLGLGLFLGIYVGVDKLTKLFAINDTYTTWTFNQANAASYTYDTNLINVGVGSSSPGVNKITNSSFDSDIVGWSAAQTYTLDDSFNTDGPETLVSGVSTLTNSGVITPASGSETIINGSMESGDPPSSWTAYGSPTLSSVSDERTNGSGSKSLNAIRGSQDAPAYQTRAGTINTWFYISGWVKNNSGTYVGLGWKSASKTTTSLTWTRLIMTLRDTTGTNSDVSLQVNGSAGNEGRFDDISIKPLTLSSLFSSVDTASSTTTVSAGVTLTTGTQAGVVMNLDSDTNPLNFIIAYHDGTNAHLDKCVNGTYTSLINTAATYSAGATIRVVRDNSGYTLSYNGTQIGAIQAVADAGIISNTRHGLFSTYSGNSFTNFLVTNGLNGSSAAPGPGTRTLNDSMSKLTIGSGVLNISGGLASSSWNNPGIWYPAINRAAGRFLIAEGNHTSGTGPFMGFDNNTSSIGGAHGIYFSNTTINVYDASAVDQPVGTVSNSTSYKFIVVLRGTGAYYYIKGGTQYPNWTLVWVSSLNSTATLYPQLGGYSGVFTSDFIRIPTATWLPTPLAYDTFNRTNGSLGSSEASGPDAQAISQQTWTGATWAISGNAAVNASPSGFATYFATVPSSQTDVLADASVTFSSGQVGVATNINNAASPTAGIIAYHDGTNIHLDKFIVAGSVTSLINQAATYSAGAVIRVVTYHSDANTLKVRLYYNNTVIGSEQTITDAAIISNTNHGLFSTNAANSIDTYALFARGSNGEYTSIPAEELTPTRDTGVHHTGAGSAKLVAPGNDANFLQSINVGGTDTYTLAAYVYKGAGQAVTTSDVNLYYDTGVITTTYTSVGSDWYYIKATLTGANASKNFGLRVKAGKTIYVDDVILYKTADNTIFTTNGYSNVNLARVDSFQATVTTPGNSSVKFQFCANDGSVCQSGNTWQYYNGSAWVAATNNTSDTNTVAQLTAPVVQALTVSGTRKVAVKAIMTIDGINFPSITSVTLGMTTDITPPVNGSVPKFVKANGDKCTYADNCWSSQTGPQYEWIAGSDSGSNMKGYCLYFGTNESVDPTSSKGKLGTSPVSTVDTPCQFIVGTNSINLGTAGYLATALSNSDTFTTAANTYYLNIKAIDNASNVSDSFVTIRFRYDGVRPDNVGFITTPSGSFSDIGDMNFAWPVSGNGVSADSQSGILGWQYQMNTTSGAWKGTAHNSEFNIDYIPVGDTSYQLTDNRDALTLVAGNNIIYFRTVDNVGNYSSDATIRTGNLSFGGQAPTFGGADVVTVTPNTTDTNNFALSWPQATPAMGQTVAHYYYSVNVPPAATLASLQSNPGTYFDAGTSTSVTAQALPNVNRLGNIVYVVAVDNADPANYSPSLYITGNFTLNSNNPDNVGNLVASDSSIKSQSKWNVTLTWTAPAYQGAGNLTYIVYRSTNGTNYTQIGTSSGLSYVDNTPASTLYYYKVVTRDGANALSSGTNAVSITPTGKWLAPAELDSGPSVVNVSTKKATITWTTSRGSDSKVAFGLASNTYDPDEPSNSAQTTGHTINLKGLNPNTTYFYKAKWTDEDGNTGESEEKMFITAAAPSVRNVQVTNTGLNYAIIKFTSVNATSVRVYYGKSPAFGGLQQVNVSPAESNYSVQLTGLDDGSKYYYKINTVDSDGYEYDGTTLDFTTVARPLVTNISIAEVPGTAQTTMIANWESNTEISSIVTYYPDGKASESRDEVNVAQIKGSHRLIIRGLQAHTKYAFIIKGIDKQGNEAVSDTYYITTSLDNRAPLISDVVIESSAKDESAQLIVSWNTDEPSTSQIEYGEGSGASYSQKSLEDSTQVYNHVVVLTNLTPSKVYHIRVLSKDINGNEGKSIDIVTITSSPSQNILELIVKNLVKTFQ